MKRFQVSGGTSAPGRRPAKVFMQSDALVGNRTKEVKGWAIGSESVIRPCGNSKSLGILCYRQHPEDYHDGQRGTDTTLRMLLRRIKSGCTWLLVRKHPHDDSPGMMVPTSGVGNFRGTTKKPVHVIVFVPFKRASRHPAHWHSTHSS